jgi:hypothetical protein
MRMLKTLLLPFTLLFAFTSYSQVSKTEPVIIQGKVIAEGTNQPVINAHVYVLDGEEETLTDSKGEFTVKSWQKTPIKLTVNGFNNYQKQSIVITDPSQKQLIRLRTKSL